MVIIAIAAAIVAPSFIGFQRSSRFRAALRQVISHAVYARAYAVSHAVIARLECDPAAGSFDLSAERDPLDHPGEFRSVRQAGRRAVRMPEGVRAESIEVAGEPMSGPGYVQFYPDGRCDGAEMVFRMNAHRRARLEIAANTGRVELHALYEE